MSDLVEDVAVSLALSLPSCGIAEYSDMLVAAKEVIDVVFGAEAIARAAESLAGMDLSDKTGQLSAARAVVAVLKEGPV